MGGKGGYDLRECGRIRLQTSDMTELYGLGSYQGSTNWGTELVGQMTLSLSSRAQNFNSTVNIMPILIAETPH